MKRKRTLIKRILSLVLTLIMIFGVVSSGGVNLTATAATTIEKFDIVEFGSYPQSEVTDTATKTALDAISASWVSYGYYTGTGSYGTMKQSDYMKYKDVTYNGEKYRAVTFSQYRPYYTYYKTSNNADEVNTEQYTNGYSTGEVYWFKYEPLKWKVLDPDTGYLLCESIIDSQAYSNTIYQNGSNYYNNSAKTIYANDYATSSIREWLNKDFYNTAFTTSAEKEAINKTTLENKGYLSTYNSANTEDYIYLPTYWDVQNEKYGFATSIGSSTTREKQGTDYAKAQGLLVSTSSSYYGNSSWRLRSAGNLSYFSCFVSCDGDVSHYYVSHTSIGVAPALNANLKSPIFTSEEHECEFEFSYVGEEHPHYDYYECAICGELLVSDSTNYDETCVDCCECTYGEPTWSWTSDYSAATAHFTCKKYSAHTKAVAAAVSSKTTPATCETNGKIVYTAKVTSEGDTYTDTKTKTIPATDHTFGSPVWSWSADYSSATAKFTCTTDGTHIQNVTATVTSKTTAATCTGNGKIVYTAKVTFLGNTYTDTKTVTLDPTGHNYGSPVWSWSNDYSSATAKFVCQNNSSHTETVTATVTSKTTPATCTENGKTVYTATVTFLGKTYTDTKTTVIPYLGHSYTSEVTKEATCKENGIITYTCSRCGHSYTIETYAEHEYELSIIEPTCTVDGASVYTCKVCGHSYSEPIPASHDYIAEVTKPATRYEDGMITYTCSRCGDSYIEVIPASNADILVVQDKLPWSENNIPVLLDKMKADGYIDGWTMTTSSSVTEYDLSQFDVIMLANDQTTATYNNIGALKSQLEQFVENGGTVIYGACDHGWGDGDISYSLLGDVEKARFSSKYNYIVDTDHPIVTGSLTDDMAITNDLLVGTYCSHNGFVESTLPEGYNIIIQDANGNATLVEYPLGDGHVILSGLTWEFYYSRIYTGTTSYSMNAFDDLVAYASKAEPACEHKYDLGTTVEPTCTTEGYTLHTCSVCGKEYKTNFVAALGHNLSDWIIDKEPDCATPGSKHQTCSRCGEVITAVIPALGHTYVSEPVWVWSDDYTSATANFICEKDETHIHGVKANVTNVVTPSTCTENGKIVYTATVKFNGITYTDTKTKILDLLEHDYTYSHYYQELPHPHYRVNVCICGAEQITDETGFYENCDLCVHKCKFKKTDRYSPDHPHRTIYACVCGKVIYKAASQNYDPTCQICNPDCEHVFEKGYFQKEHPHYTVNVCTICSAEEVTDEVNIDLTCKECYPDPHEHNYEPAYNQTAHPHYTVYKCSCGDWFISEEENDDPSCKTCHPDPHEHKYTFNRYSDAHPHYLIYKCECGHEVMANKTMYIGSCIICNPDPVDPPEHPKPPVDDCSHDYKYTGQTEAHPHYDMYECSLCGDTFYGGVNFVEDCDECNKHTHSYTTYVGYQAEHPHYKVYECSCGARYVSSIETYVESCDECTPPHDKHTYTLAYIQKDHPHYGVYRCSCGDEFVSFITHYDESCPLCVDPPVECEHNLEYSRVLAEHPHYTVYKCTLCEKEFVSAQTNIPQEGCDECNHTHNYTLAYYQTEHPHYAVYQCSCGDWYVDKDKTTEYKDCYICNPFTVSGTVDSENIDPDNIAPTEITLVSVSDPTVSHKVTVSGDSYVIEGVLPGTYTLSVAKENHVTREYTVTVTNKDVTQNAKIHLLGDITGDGKISSADMVMLNAHVRKTSYISGYVFACADVSGDGKLTTTDVVKLNAHVRKVLSLWK